MKEYITSTIHDKDGLVIGSNGRSIIIGQNDEWVVLGKKNIRDIRRIIKGHNMLAGGIFEDITVKRGNNPEQLLLSQQNNTVAVSGKLFNDRLLNRCV